jgi:hypothetical protein
VCLHSPSVVVEDPAAVAGRDLDIRAVPALSKREGEGEEGEGGE